MHKSIQNIIVLVIVLSAIVISLAFSMNGLSKVKCSEVLVVIKKDSPRFLEEEDISEIIIKAQPEIKEKTLYQIDTNVLEEKLETVASIKKAEVYRKVTGTKMDFKGCLCAEIEQRSPIVRIISGSKDYYLDIEGVKIPTNDKFTAKVMIVNGFVKDKFTMEKLLPFAQFINSDEFWSAMIEQVYVRQNEELVLVPRIGDQLVEFGKVERVEEKFRNLKALYQQIFAETGWDKYRSINLKYSNQVVCTKR